MSEIEGRREPKYPDVYVELVGQDSSTGAIINRVTRELHALYHSMDDTAEANADYRAQILADIKTFRESIFSHDYNGILRLVGEYVSVGRPEDYE